MSYKYLTKLASTLYKLSTSFFAFALSVFCAVIYSSSAIAQQDSSNLDIYRQSIYQIVVNEYETGNKSALGSGFQISADGLLVTNYHVIAGYIFEPEQRWLEYVDSEGNTGELELVDFDVINDVALVRADGLGQQHFQISEDIYRKGDRIFAMGNPLDYGMLVVDGAYNGIAENSYVPKILFSGSLNSGMSGGPAVDSSGAIVGVNVATAGSQLSFLVPAEKIQALLKDTNRPNSIEDYMPHMGEQIERFQVEYYEQLLVRDWASQSLGENAQVIGEMASDVSCWGGTNQNRPDAEDVYIIQLFCNNGNNTFLQNRFNAGQMHYSFYHYETETLTPDQFHDLVGNQSFGPDNQAPERFVTEFECQQDYVDIGEELSDSGFRQAGLCFRAYTDFDGLYDVLYYLFQGQDDQALVSHFTLSGVTQDVAIGFSEKFMGVAHWN